MTTQQENAELITDERWHASGNGWVCCEHDPLFQTLVPENAAVVAEMHNRLLEQRNRARDIAAALEQQLADLHELHQSWGNTDVQDLDPQALWEDFETVLTRAVSES